VHQVLRRFDPNLDPARHQDLGRRGTTLFLLLVLPHVTIVANTDTTFCESDQFFGQFMVGKLYIATSIETFAERRVSLSLRSRFDSGA
jgi:hypothetical protein